jgi:hypothetical protein
MIADLEGPYLDHQVSHNPQKVESAVARCQIRND